MSVAFLPDSRTSSCRVLETSHILPLIRIFTRSKYDMIPVAVRSKAWVYGRSLAGIVGSNPAGTCMSPVSVVCCQVGVSASGRSLVQRSLTKRGVSKRDRGSSIMRRPWPTRAVASW
jgi:hypothetical protein